LVLITRILVRRQQTKRSTSANDALAFYVWESVLKSIEHSVSNSPKLDNVDIVNWEMIHLLFFLFHTFTVDKRQNFAWSCVMLIKSITKSLSSIPSDINNNNIKENKSTTNTTANNTYNNSSCYSILAASRLLMLVTYVFQQFDSFPNFVAEGLEASFFQAFEKTFEIELGYSEIHTAILPIETPEIINYLDQNEM